MTTAAANGPALTGDIAPQVRRRMYELMSLMKAVDDRVTSAIRTGQVVAIYYSHRGQEAIAAALGAALRPTDQLVTTYRGLHDHLAKGGPLVDLLGGVLGRDIGAGRGKSHILSLSQPEVGAMLSTGIVGGGLPIAAGLALSAQLEGADRVTAVCFGDGASNTGSFHEAMNLASLWNLPVVFVCQNNLYGEKTPFRDSMKVGHVADRAAAYAIPGISVNGNDPDATYRVLAEAVERARSGGGPTLVECMTYRFRGHSLGDTMAYMPKEERAAAEASDPVPAYRHRLIGLGVMSEAELDELDQQVTDQVTDALKLVLAAPPPSAADLLTDRYADAENIPV
jgi:acetoin:2,6-dichlorophenolindophenol oxidoreductase subunit alpha